jgi:hypothetical protein
MHQCTFWGEAQELGHDGRRVWWAVRFRHPTARRHTTTKVDVPTVLSHCGASVSASDGRGRQHTRNPERIARNGPPAKHSLHKLCSGLRVSHSPHVCHCPSATTCALSTRSRCCVLLCRRPKRVLCLKPHHSLRQESIWVVLCCACITCYCLLFCTDEMKRRCTHRNPQEGGGGGGAVDVSEEDLFGLLTRPELWGRRVKCDVRGELLAAHARDGFFMELHLFFHTHSNACL